MEAPEMTLEEVSIKTEGLPTNTSGQNGLFSRRKYPNERIPNKSTKEGVLSINNVDPPNEAQTINHSKEALSTPQRRPLQKIYVI